MSITRTDARRIALRHIERQAKSHGEGTKALAWWLFEFLAGDSVHPNILRDVLHLPIPLAWEAWGLRMLGGITHSYVAISDPTRFADRLAAHYDHEHLTFTRYNHANRINWARGVVIRMMPVLAHITARNMLRDLAQ